MSTEGMTKHTPSMDDEHSPKSHVNTSYLPLLKPDNEKGNDPPLPPRSTTSAWRYNPGQNFDCNITLTTLILVPSYSSFSSTGLLRRTSLLSLSYPRPVYAFLTGVHLTSTPVDLNTKKSMALLPMQHLMLCSNPTSQLLSRWQLH